MDGTLGHESQLALTLDPGAYDEPRRASVFEPVRGGSPLPSAAVEAEVVCFLGAAGEVGPGAP